MRAALPTQQDYRSMAYFRYGLRQLLRFSKELVRSKARLTPEQYEVLLALKAFSNDNGLTVMQLSERAQVRHHTVVSLTDKLAARKLVTKRRAQHDRRHVHVKLTASGNRLLATLAAAHRREIRMRAADIIRPLTELKK